MNHSSSRSKSGPEYLIQGFSLITQPGLRTHVIIPLIINIVLFSVGFYFAVAQIDAWIAWMNAQLPSWLSWLEILLYPLAILAVIIVMSFFFSSLMNWIAAPFNGLLAEKVEQHLTGKSLDTGGAVDMVKDIPRILGREWAKLAYFLPRAILLLLLFFVPVIGTLLAPILWFLFNAWMMSIQYCDYPFDNHRVSFPDMRYALGQRKGKSYSFGASIALCAMIPFVNFLIMPVAVCGATAIWVDNYRAQYRNPAIAAE